MSGLPLLAITTTTSPSKYISVGVPVTDSLADFNEQCQPIRECALLLLLLLLLLMLKSMTGKLSTTITSPNRYSTERESASALIDSTIRLISSQSQSH